MRTCPETISLCGAKCLGWHVDKGSWYALGHAWSGLVDLDESWWLFGSCPGRQSLQSCQHPGGHCGQSGPVDHSRIAVVQEHQTP